MIEEKEDCLDSLIFGLNRTAEWRKKMAAKYPLDPRNVRAADCLSQLASEAKELSDRDWLQLQPHSGWANERFREAISDAARAVGFVHKVKDLSSFVKHLLEVLSQPSIAA
jgi:hypothetical protein